jgi:F-type H+-transporting ATPase subunit delta
MANRQVTRRYAQALYEEADRQGHLSSVDEDVNFLRESLDEAPELARVLRSPVISRSQTQGVLDSLVKPRVGGLTWRFVELLLRKGRAEELGAMLDAYRSLRDKQEGVVEALVRTAHPLSDQEHTRLEKAVTRLTGQPNVRLTVERHPDLIGGVVVRVGDTVYDGSVQHQLHSLRERLTHRADVSGATNDGSSSSGSNSGEPGSSEPGDAHEQRPQRESGDADASDSTEDDSDTEDNSGVA